MRIISVISIVLILTACASANIVTYNYSKSLTSTNWAQTFNVPKFDSTLGTLDSVTITVGGNLSQTFMFENQDGAGTIQFYNGNTTGCMFKVKYTGGSDLVAMDILNTPSYSFTDFDGIFDFGGSSGKTDTVAKSQSFFNIFTDITTLSSFTGTGSIGIDATATGRSYWQATSGNISVGVSTRAGSDVTVAYSYTVPEPATMGLLAIGGLILRRKK